MNPPDDHSEHAEEKAIRQEASLWVVRHSYGLSPSEQDDYFDWMARDPRHSEAYQELCRTWRRLDLLADWRPEHSMKPNPDLLDVPVPRKASRAVWSWLAIAAVVLVSLGLWSVLRQNTVSAPYRLAVGEFARGYERHELEDGSVVELNLGAQVAVDFSRKRRFLTLLSGEAYFTVAKDAKRPFVVSASGVAVRAVGTVFNVRMSPSTVRVLVTEGRVRVGPADEDAPASTGVNQGPPRELFAGQQSTIELRKETQSAVQVDNLSLDQVGEQLTWLKQVIDFNSTPLSLIVDEFNRRNYRKIIIRDPSIENIEFSGAIRPHNIDDFIELLRLTSGIQAEEVGDSVILLRAKP